VPCDLITGHEVLRCGSPEVAEEVDKEVEHEILETELKVPGVVLVDAEEEPDQFGGFDSAAPDGSQPATHISCTVEMANLTRPIDVAVVDEVCCAPANNDSNDELDYSSQ
jgi:hypothetical protein